ncbi:streptomycin 6-kinase [Cytobacillus eiseniae]|uniref:Streptomycin 6-kinase n=1 Tax=Cytobacillus eiseniae TaxID=762947 RepID=A0ABS4RIM0_9BACI|nr:aminoglycoside phosphotransferase family protein [Cytobacillus eiseniae]MBP2242757.1 streptomycin 6-kinase [Cytobacillus eiseniae]
MIPLPNRFRQTILSIHKEKGEEWLNNFNHLIDECEKRWQIKVMAPFALSYNFVAPALRRDGTEVVVKLTPPSEEFHTEVSALQLYNGHGIVKIVDVDPQKGILILERLLPGNTLADLENDEEATYIASKVMKKLWIPGSACSQIPTSEQREKSLLKIYEENPIGFGPVTKEILQEATEVFMELNRTIIQPYFLHGDLHHYNILMSGSNSWTAIDPKGLVGDREYDVIQFLLNKLPNDHMSKVIENRIDIFTKELGLDKERICLWGFAHAVLSTCWSVQDHSHYSEAFYQAIHVFRKQSPSL